MARNLHWRMMDKAMQIAQAHNFHKKESLKGLSLLDQENQLRVFWSLYQMDRLLAFERRAPYVIPEAEIDIPLFADINEEETDEAVILEARKPGYVPPKSTNFSLSLHGLRIIRIEAEIIDSIYRVDKTYKEQFPKVEPFLKRLDDWKVQCPRYMGHGQIIMEMHHARAVRLLLQPFLGFLEPTSPLFIRCMRQSGQIAQGCTEICRVIKGFNLMSANALFMSGLTLIYGLWLASKSNLNYQYIIEDIRLCTCCLYALAERSSVFAHYRDTIDNLASATIRHVSELASKRYVIVSNLPDQQSSSDAVTFSEENSETRSGRNSSKPPSEAYPSSTLLSSTTKICSKSGVLIASDNVRYPIPITTSQNVNGKLEPSLQGSSDEETHTIFRLQKQLNKDSHEKFKQLQDLKRKHSETGNQAEPESPADGHTSKYLRQGLNSKTAPQTPQSSDSDHHQLIAELVNNLQQTPQNVSIPPQTSGVVAPVGTSSSSFSSTTLSGQPPSPYVPSLGNRFASGGSSVSWWNNLEQRLHVSESPRNWVNALGSHDGVTTWIHDLSAFAKQHLSSGGNNNCESSNSNSNNFSSTASAVVAVDNLHIHPNEHTDTVNSSNNGHKDNSAHSSSLNELLYGNTHGATSQQQQHNTYHHHHVASTPGSGVSQAPSPLNFLAAASEYAAAGGLDNGAGKSGGSAGEGETSDPGPRNENVTEKSSREGATTMTATSEESIGGFGGEPGDSKSKENQEKGDHHHKSHSAVAPITISIASSLGDLYAATTVPAMVPEGAPATPDDGQQVTGSGGAAQMHSNNGTVAATATTVGEGERVEVSSPGHGSDLHEHATATAGATGPNANNANNANFSMYDGSLPAVGSGGALIEEYGDWAYDVNLFYYNDLVTWSL